ncbi:MAG: 2,3-bisphosphoglycerate-independent phosphoglycerate mutase [Candidatus Binataceae bacterium]|nr:2,3-bisphosphoglycerate-independent phosphoglycerate mutase [Candidatus Binataceae bacterium]
MSRPPVTVLVIFDGWGLRKAREDNAIAQARTPTMDRLWATQAHTEIEASGEAVGLMAGVMGNSEVGHLTIGAGRVIFQDVMRITKAIESGAFFRNQQLLGAIRKARDTSRALHLWGLLSDGSVHSHLDHLLALLDLAAGEKLRSIAVHAVLDGRDKPPRSALPFVDQIEAKLREIGCGRIATVSGRYYAMDRDKRWDRVERAWQAIANSEGNRAPSARAAIEAAYANGKDDEFLDPCIIGEPIPINDGDQVICYNFRADRARELTAALALEKFSGFARPRVPKIGYICMTEYDRGFGLPLAFSPDDVSNPMAAALAGVGVRNLRIAETEKYAHVTYFLNGGVEQPFPFEERALIASSKVATYDLEPTMQADPIADRVAQEIVNGRFGVIVVNFANPDMVGHTGKMKAAVEAIEASDHALGKIVAALERARGVALITADHGNAEFMADPATGQPHTAHTTNPVPLMLFDPAGKARLREGGTLADIAPTLLGILEIEPPKEMTGRDLRAPV